MEIRRSFLEKSMPKKKFKKFIGVPTSGERRGFCRQSEAVISASTGSLFFKKECVELQKYELSECPA